MPAPEGILTVQLGVELLAAARKYADENGVELSSLIRKGLAREISQKHLAKAVRPRGRPRKEPAKH